MGSLDWHVTRLAVYLRRLPVMFCPGHACVKENSGAERLAAKATATRGLRPGRSEVLRSLRHWLREGSQRHHTIYRLKGINVERGSARRFSLEVRRERAIFSQTNIETV